MATRVHADSTIAHCQLSHHNPSIPLQSGPCRFSQRQGNVTIMFRDQTFNFPYSAAGQSYQRSNSTTGIRFDMSGGATIEVLWR
ncbi:putative conserved secreted protein [Synechococcus sp. MIT S9220]|nr:putative conserved secreted protein [Synechococcus sp. MIT S9220]